MYIDLFMVCTRSMKTPELTMQSPFSEMQTLTVNIFSIENNCMIHLTNTLKEVYLTRTKQKIAPSEWVLIKAKTAIWTRTVGRNKWNGTVQYKGIGYVHCECDIKLALQKWQYKLRVTLCVSYNRYSSDLKSRH